MCSLIDILQWKKKIQKDSDDFWHRKLTLKIKFWYFLTAPHYSNFKNLVISFEYSWFLAKNLSNFVSLSWKLHNRKCHSYHISLHLVCAFCTLSQKTRDMVCLFLTVRGSSNNKEYSFQYKMTSELNVSWQGFKKMCWLVFVLTWKDFFFLIKNMLNWGIHSVSYWKNLYQIGDNSGWYCAKREPP